MARAVQAQPALHHRNAGGIDADPAGFEPEVERDGRKQQREQTEEKGKITGACAKIIEKTNPRKKECSAES